MTGTAARALAAEPLGRARNAPLAGGGAVARCARPAIAMTVRDRVDALTARIWLRRCQRGKPAPGRGR